MYAETYRQKERERERERIFSEAIENVHCLKRSPNKIYS
jgi:hypothetical protein